MCVNYVSRQKGTCASERGTCASERGMSASQRGMSASERATCASERVFCASESENCTSERETCASESGTCASERGVCTSKSISRSIYQICASFNAFVPRNQVPRFQHFPTPWPRWPPGWWITCLRRLSSRSTLAMREKVTSHLDTSRISEAMEICWIHMTLLKNRVCQDRGNTWLVFLDLNKLVRAWFPMGFGYKLKGRGGLSRGKIQNGHLDPPRVVYREK